MDYKETYEKFWSVGVDSQFKDYERNLILPDFFPITERQEKVADIAGGSGIVSEWLQNRGYEVCLVEFSDLAVDKAKKRGIKYIYTQMVGGENHLPFEGSSFDYVFFGDIIEHLFDSESALIEINRILKTGSKLIISCPNIAYWRFRVYYLIDGDFQRIDVARQKPWEQEHIRFFNIKILKNFLGILGFRFVKYRGVNNIWHSKFLSKLFPNLFAHTLIAEFEKI